MKKTLLIVIIISSATSLQTQAQKVDTIGTNTNHNVDAKLLLKKSRNQKAVAWVLLGGGILSTSLGSVRVNPDGYFGGSDNSRSTLFLVAGLAAMGTSIPFFIASGKNKRKANLILKNENGFFNPSLNSKKPLVAIALQINFQNAK